MSRSEFDMALFNVLPEAREVIAPIAAVSVMTNGSVRDGELSHPSVWNGDRTMLAFFALAPEHVEIEPLMATHHKVAPPHYWTNEPCVRVSMADAMQDCWTHHYGMFFECEGTWVKVWDSFPLQNDFMARMYHIRKWHELPEPEVEKIKSRVLGSLKDAVARFVGVTGVTVNVLA